MIPFDRPCKRSDIPDVAALALAFAWRWGKEIACVGDALVAIGFPPKVVLRKLEHLNDRGLMDCGTTVWSSWPTDEGIREMQIAQLRALLLPLEPSAPEVTP